MKKILLALGLLSLMAPLCVAQQNQNLQQKLNQKLDVALSSIPRSYGAHENAVFEITLELRTRFETQVQENDNQTVKSCTAVKIDGNWLVASLTCRGTTPTATAYTRDGNSYPKNVKYRHIEGARLGRAKIPASDIFVNEQAKLILIRAQRSNHKLAKALDKKGTVVANLLIAKQPQKLLSSIQEAYINRDKACPMFGRCTPSVTIEKYCTENKCYRIEWKLIEGKSGDPLFLTSKNQGPAEFLAGLNIAETDSREVYSSSDYKVFGQDAYNFFQQTIGSNDADAWQRITKYMVDETTF